MNQSNQHREQQHREQQHREHQHRLDTTPDLRDRGQATTEYALILLGAALVGLLVVAWATAGGATGRIGQLFDAVVDSVISRL